MEDDTIKILAVIVGITILEAIALFQGINGTQLVLVIGTLAGIGGFAFGKKRTD